MDKRKNNGGHSTKATGIDKRKNQYKDALDQAGDVESVTEVLKMLHNKAVTKLDTKAAQIYLDYYLGKPNQSVNINPDNDFNIPLIKFFE